jgi:hypothetical protein
MAGAPWQQKQPLRRRLRPPRDDHHLASEEKSLQRPEAEIRVGNVLHRVLHRGAIDVGARVKRVSGSVCAYI